MPTYSEIKAELLEIVQILEKYPESIQPKVFDVLLNNYLKDANPDLQESTPIREIPQQDNSSATTKVEKKRRSVGKYSGPNCQDTKTEIKSPIHSLSF